MNEQVHPLFKDILNSVQNLEKSVDTASKSIWDLIRVDTPANTIEQVKAGTVIKDRDGKTIITENVLDSYIIFIYERNTLSLKKDSVSALLKTGEWQIIGGPEPKPEPEIYYFDLLQVGDRILRSDAGIQVVRQKTDGYILMRNSNLHWYSSEINYLINNGSWYIITDLEEQGQSPAEIKAEYIELLKKYNEAEIARYNFREKIGDAWVNGIVRVWEIAPLVENETGGPRLYDIDKLVIE